MPLHVTGGPFRHSKTVGGRWDHPAFPRFGPATIQDGGPLVKADPGAASALPGYLWGDVVLASAGPGASLQPQVPAAHDPFWSVAWRAAAIVRNARRQRNAMA
jgi:hypothetical protein